MMEHDDSHSERFTDGRTLSMLVDHASAPYCTCLFELRSITDFPFSGKMHVFGIKILHARSHIRFKALLFLQTIHIEHQNLLNVDVVRYQ
mmetsp:Transcript_9759/g.14504  ORF Transcript_9759/g.14504 Transcript_9759/m.14504 type:complete len:90 (-) Transcript_9759:45-314(-)